MKIAYRLFLILLISIFLFSCSEKKASIEGKLLDGRGQPIYGITVIFKQVQASKGYEQFETKTLATGVFRIDGVMPSSEYIITPVSDKWKTKVTRKITTLAEGQTLALSTPFVIRFNALKDGSVADTKTGLQWLILPIKDLNSSNVLNSVRNIKEGGFTDWRLPTKAEILQIQETPDAPVKQPETGLSQKACCAWVAELNSDNVEWKFYVDDGNDVWASSNVPPDDRIVVVRNYAPPATDVQTPAVSATQTAAAPTTPVTESPSVVASPAKQEPLAKVKTPAQPDDSVGDSVTIQFAINKSIISPKELSKLKAFYAKIKGTEGRIVIEGNSDSDGDAADNFRVSGERALSVKAMLHKLELSKDFDVKIVGLSDTQPIADNTTEAGRKLNRRADITFIPESSAAAATSSTTSTRQLPSAKIKTPSVKKSEDVVIKASRKACIANKDTSAKSGAAALPSVQAPPAKQSPSAKSRATAAPEVSEPAKQPVLAKVQPPPVKSEDAVLRASRKACSAKKAQTAK